METFISEEWNHSWTIVTSSLSSLCTEMSVSLYLKKKGVLFTQLHRLPPADFNRMLSLSTFNLYMPDTVYHHSIYSIYKVYQDAQPATFSVEWLWDELAPHEMKGTGMFYIQTYTQYVMNSWPLFHCECNCLCVSLRACVRQKGKIRFYNLICLDRIVICGAYHTFSMFDLYKIKVSLSLM